MTLTKKSKAVQSIEDSTPVLEGELIDEGSVQSEKPIKIQSVDKPSLSFNLGKIVGVAGTFLLGFFQNLRMDKPARANQCQGRGRKIRSKRKMNRRK